MLRGQLIAIDELDPAYVILEFFLAFSFGFSFALTLSLFMLALAFVLTVAFLSLFLPFFDLPLLLKDVRLWRILDLLGCLVAWLLQWRFFDPFLVAALWR